MLDVVSGRLSHIRQFDRPVTRKRIEQAIDRRPELRNLLEPVLEELDESDRLLLAVKAMVAAAKKLVEKVL